MEKELCFIKLSDQRDEMHELFKNKKKKKGNDSFNSSQPYTKV